MVRSSRPRARATPPRTARATESTLSSATRRRPALKTCPDHRPAQRLCAPQKTIQALVLAHAPLGATVRLRKAARVVPRSRATFLLRENSGIGGSGVGDCFLIALPGVSRPIPVAG